MADRLSTREKLMGGGMALAIVGLFAKGQMDRVVGHVDDKHAHPVSIVEKHERELAQVSNGLTDVIKTLKELDADRMRREEQQRLEMQRKADEEKRDAQRRAEEDKAFWLRQQEARDQKIIGEMMRQQQQAPPAVIVAPPVAPAR